MKLARFLAEVRRRTKTTIPDEIDPIGLILARVGMHPGTLESKALAKATLAVIAHEGEMTEQNLWALSADALGLLDRFAIERLSQRYRPQDLEAFTKRLRRAL